MFDRERLTHPGTVDSEIDASKLLYCHIHQVLHAVLVGYVHFIRNSLEVCMSRKFIAFLSSAFGARLVDVGKNDPSDASFRERKSGLLADSASRLVVLLRQIRSGKIASRNCLLQSQGRFRLRAVSLMPC